MEIDGELRAEAMEKASFPGTIEVVDNPESVRACLTALQGEPLLGFDTESKPQFVKGMGQNAVALVQLSTWDRAYLVRTCLLGGLPDEIVALLANPSIVKLGVSVQEDVRRLGLRMGTNAHGFVDLANMAAAVGLEERGLRGLCSRVMGLHLSKSAQLSNWESDVLTERQQLYAATDAWISLALYLSATFASCRNADNSPLPEFILKPLSSKASRRKASKKAHEEKDPESKAHGTTVEGESA